MVQISLYALSVLSLAQNAYSIAFNMPAPTATQKIELELHAVGQSPKPTEAPKGFAAHFDLFKRATGFPDTCGWVATSSVLACNIGTCALFSSGSIGMQGCCYSGYKDCNFLSTCYDYDQYTSSKCTGSCYSNDFNLVCTRALSAYCQTYTWPGQGVVGYGCASDSASTTKTITSTYSGVSMTTANPSTAPESAYLAALSSATASGYSYSYKSATYTYKSATYSYRSGGSGYSTGSTVAAAGILLAPLIAFLVIYGLGYCCALAIIIIMCRRSKRLMALWDQPGGARSMAAGNQAVTIQPVPSTSTNILSPDQNQQQYYSTPANGAAAGYYDASKGTPSPQSQNVYPVTPRSPAPMYTSQPSVGHQQPYGQPNVQPYVGGYQAYQAPQDVQQPTAQPVPQQQTRNVHELQ